MFKFYNIAGGVLEEDYPYEQVGNHETQPCTYDMNNTTELSFDYPAVNGGFEEMFDLIFEHPMTTMIATNYVFSNYAGGIIDSESVCSTSGINN